MLGSVKVKRRNLYFALIGLIAAASIVAFAFAPSLLAGVVGIVVAGLILVVGRIFRDSVDPRPRRPAAVVLLVLGGVTYVGSLFLAGTLLHEDDASWVAWILAFIVFAITFAGAWIPDRPGRDQE